MFIVLIFSERANSHLYSYCCTYEELILERYVTYTAQSTSPSPRKYIRRKKKPQSSVKPLKIWKQESQFRTSSSTPQAADLLSECPTVHRDVWGSDETLTSFTMSPARLSAGVVHDAAALKKCGDAPQSWQESPLSHVWRRPCLVLTNSLRRTNPAVSPLHAPAALDLLLLLLLLPGIDNLRREKDDIKIQRQHAAGPIMWMSKQLFETADCECQFRWIKRRLVLVVLYTWKITFLFLVCPKSDHGERSSAYRLKGLGLKLKGLSRSLVRYELLIQRGSMWRTLS